MVGQIERYRPRVFIQIICQNVKQRFDSEEIHSYPFFARNFPFHFGLYKNAKGFICCSLICKGKEEGFSINAKYQLSLITPSNTVASAKFSCTFKCEKLGQRRVLSKIFPGEEIIVDDSIRIKLSLWLKEPEGIDFQPPKEKLRRSLQTAGAQAHANSYQRLLESGDFSDLTFVVNEDSSRVKAHKNILAAHSEVFARMLATEMAEAKDNEIKIEDMGTPALKIMLRHIYTGQLGFPEEIKVDLKICQELVYAGEKYDLQNLKEYAAMAMTEFTSLANAWELLSFAKRLKATAATKALTSYYVDNVYHIIDKM